MKTAGLSLMYSLIRRYADCVWAFPHECLMGMTTNTQRQRRRRRKRRRVEMLLLK